MAEMRKRQVFGTAGNLLSEESYEVPDEVLAREQAPARLKQLLTKGKAAWTTADLNDIAEALLQLMRPWFSG